MALIDQIIKMDEEAEREASNDLRDQYCDMSEIRHWRSGSETISANPQ